MSGVQIRAAGNRVTLTLMGDVGYEITASAVQKALKEAAGAPLTISLNSYGGDATMGIAIHNMLARYPGAKTVVVEGIAASAASLIAMAGDIIVMPSNAFLMIHEAWGGAAGDADAMRSMAETLDMVSGAYRRTYAARTGKSEDEIAALMAAETWFTADAALEAGFATQVSEPAEVRADARRLARFTKVPAALSAPAQTTTPSAPDVPAAPVAEEVLVTDTPNPAPVQAAVSTPLLVIPSATLAEIQAVATRARLGAEFVVAQLSAGVGIQAVQDAAIDAIAAVAPPPLQPSAISIARDAGDTLRARLSGAFAAGVVATANGKPAVYSDDQREFAGASMHGVIRELLAARGERNVHRLSNSELAERVLALGSHTASDFAGVLANTLNKTVRDLYGAYPNTWSSWCDEVEVEDYKQITAASIGQVSEVLPIQDGGQVIFGTIAEDLAETYAVSERGVLLPVGKQSIVNDDARALARAAQNMALGAYTGLRRVVFGILTANANMADGIALFAAGHNNLATASGLDAAAFRALRQLLQAQTGPVRPGRPAAPLPPVQSVALLVGPARETVAYELTTPLIVPTGVGAALPTAYRSSTNVVMEALLGTGTNPFYMIRTEPGMRPVEIAYIRGMRTPMVTSAERIDYTGVTFRCLFDFGAKSVTWRTAAGNLGT